MKLTRPPLPCLPPRWAKSGYLQSLFGNYLAAPPFSAQSERTEIDLPDGDRLVARVFAPPPEVRTGKREVVLCGFHGLGGNCDRHYMRRIAALGHARGCTVYSVNHRGCGEGRGLAKGIYHSGVAADLSAVFAEVRKRHPQALLIGIGFSLSANALLLCLGDGHGGPHHKPDAAIAINPPIHLSRCADLISAPHHRIFNLYFLRGCVRYVREREADGLIPKGRYPVHLRMSLQEFDDAFTAPLGGFRDRNDYYQRSSALPHLPNITQPTVIIHAEDDPFIDPSDFQRARYGSGIHLHLEQHGGHLGYVSANQPYRRWLDYAVGHYLDQLLDAHS